MDLPIPPAPSELSLKADSELAAYDADAPLWNDNVVRGENAGVALLQKERPHHRLFVELRCRGYSTSEIARITGFTNASINMVLRQPWARRRLVEHLRTASDDLQRLLEQEAAESILTLVEVRDDESARGSERIAASNSLLDRYLGKPTQRIETTKGPTADDVASLQRELEQLRAEEGRLKAN